MPHVTLELSAGLAPALDLTALCAALAAAIGAVRDGTGAPVFPLGGTRVFARPAAASSIADGDPSHAFLYVNARIAPGRRPEVVRQLGDAMVRVVDAAIAPLLASRTIGWTLQIDEQVAVFDHKGGGNLKSLLAARDSSRGS